MRTLPPVALALLTMAVPALASVTVTAPANYSTVNTTFQLSASASPCSSQSIAAMGYSFDNGATTIVNAAAINATITGPTGSHTLHVKSWGNQGASCVANVNLTIVQAPATDIVVASPTLGASVTSPFAVAANGTVCQSQGISAFGYSLDDSSSTTIVNGTSFTGQITAATGAHTVHVKSWGNQGSSCVSDIAVTVLAPAATVSGPQIPSNAVAINSIQQLTNWKADFDTGTSGTASGSMNLVSAPAVSNASRLFSTTYSNYGGERYSTYIGNDTVAQNFVFDTQIYLASPLNSIANIELDMNQVMPNGETVIFGFQCDGWSQTWDYTQNTGTPTNPNDQWMHSNQTCNPQAWAPNTWHHFQVSYSRDSSGYVTYKSVWLDGVQQDLNVTVSSAFALGWSPALIVNVQVDGMTATPGSSTMYLDKMSLYRW